MTGRVEDHRGMREAEETCKETSRENNEEAITKEEVISAIKNLKMEKRRDMIKSVQQ